MGRGATNTVTVWAAATTRAVVVLGVARAVVVDRMVLVKTALEEMELGVTMEVKEAPRLKRSVEVEACATSSG